MISDLSSSFRKGVLNPNAREFVPITKAYIVDDTESLTVSRNDKASTQKVGCSDLCGSEEESKRFWDAQLPDDILSLDTDVIARSTISSAYCDSLLTSLPNDQNADSKQCDRTISGKHMQTLSRIAESNYSNSDDVLINPAGQVWENNQALLLQHQTSMPIRWDRQLSSNENEVTQTASLREKPYLCRENGTLNAFYSSAAEFPNIPSLSGADATGGDIKLISRMADATGGDINLISRMASQLKMQDEGNYEHNIPFTSNISSSPRLPDVLAHRNDFGNEFLNHVGQSKQYQMECLRLMAKSKLPWRYEWNAAAIRNHVGPSSPPSSNPYNSFYIDDIRSTDEESQILPCVPQNFQVSAQSLPVTDNAFVNLLAKLREEARDHARIRNAYFEQARQAYFVGDKILARDAGAEGQLHNRLMKVAQNKAAELIFEQRNMSSAQISRIDPGESELLDLRGLHVNEAVALLKRKLSGLRMIAKLSKQHQQILISVGAGHAKGFRAPSRLLTAVKRHLVEEELLSYTEPQPGIVSVVVS